MTTIRFQLARSTQASHRLLNPLHTPVSHPHVATQSSTGRNECGPCDSTLTRRWRRPRAESSGDSQAHHKQKRRRLDVCTVADGEALVRLRQEEVEPDPRRERAEHTGHTIASDSNGDNGNHHQKYRVGIGEGRPKRCEGGRRDRRDTDGSTPHKSPVCPGTQPDGSVGNDSPFHTTSRSRLNNPPVSRAHDQGLSSTGSGVGRPGLVGRPGTARDGAEEPGSPRDAVTLAVRWADTTE